MRSSSLLPDDHLVEPGREAAALDDARCPPRTSNARGVTARRVTLVGSRRLLLGQADHDDPLRRGQGLAVRAARDAVVHHDLVALLERHRRRSAPSPSRAARSSRCRSGRWRAARPEALGHGHEHGEDRHHQRDAARPPAASPASARARCGRCRRAGAPWSDRPQHVGDARAVGVEGRHEAGGEAQEQGHGEAEAPPPPAAGSARERPMPASMSLMPGMRSIPRGAPAAADTQRAAQRAQDRPPPPRSGPSRARWRSRASSARRSRCAARARPCSWCWR